LMLYIQCLISFVRCLYGYQSVFRTHCVRFVLAAAGMPPVAKNCIFGCVTGHPCVVAFLTAVACSGEHPASANVGTIHKHPAGRWRQSTRPIQTVNKILIQHSCLYRFNSSYCLLPESCYLFCLFSSTLINSKVHARHARE
jgi:hypothetical protein